MQLFITVLMRQTVQQAGINDVLFCSSQPLCVVSQTTILQTFQNTNLVHNSFNLQQYICYTTLLNMFRAARCSPSGETIVSLQPLVSSPFRRTHSRM